MKTRCSRKLAGLLAALLALAATSGCGTVRGWGRGGGGEPTRGGASITLPIGK